MTDEMDFETQLDLAFDEMPLAPLPEDFMPRLMERVTAVSQPEPFRLSPSDAVVPALIALLFATLWGLSQLNVTFSSEAVRGVFFGSGWAAVVALIVAVELAMGAVLCFWLLAERPLEEIGF